MTGDVAVVGLSTRFPGAATIDQYWSLIREGRSGLTRLSTEELLAQGVPPTMVRDRKLRAGRRHHRQPIPFRSGSMGIHRSRAIDSRPATPHVDGVRLARARQQRTRSRSRSWCRHRRRLRRVHTEQLPGAQPLRSVGFDGRWARSTGQHADGNCDTTGLPAPADRLPPRPDRARDSGLDQLLDVSRRYRLATQSLLSGECDTALAGGVSAIVPQGRGYLHVEGGVFSRDGEIAPFGARGSGIVFSQGAGAVVLRRLDDAIADSDPILAVLHGSAVNNDGTDTAGFTAPSVRGQARVVADALAAADADPSDIGLIEAHGTATRLGDPIELAALRTVFGQGGPPWCGLGSVKGNIGHTNSAAGTASFAKTVLAIHHRTLPVSLGSDAPAEGLRLPGSPFELLRETRPWDTPPLAGVSSFGIGGTNAHVVLGPAPVASSRPPAFDRPVLLISSGATPGGARAAADAIADFAPLTSPVDLAHTLAVGRAEFAHRTAAVLDPTQPRARPSFSEPVAARTQTPR